MKPPEVEYYISRLFDKRVSVRRDAANRLSKVGDLSITPGLRKVARVDVGTNSAFAANSDITSIEAVIPTLAESLSDTNWSVRMFAARALGIIGNSRATPALIEALKDRDVRVSGRAAEALGKIGDVLAVPGLIAVIESRLQKDWFNRKYAAVAMAAIGNSETLPLKVVACSYFSAQVRIEVLAKLRRLRYSKTYHDPSRNIRLRYIFPDTHQLCQLLIAEGDPVNREAAQTILNWLNGERQLLIPSLPAVSTPPVLLLRAVKGVPSVALVKQMLRPVDSSRHNVKPLKPRMRLRDRLFQKFSLPRCHNRSSSYRQSGK